MAESWVLKYIIHAMSIGCCACCWFPQHSRSCASCDPLCNKLYIAGANPEGFAIVNLIAEREGIEPRLQKRWDRFLGEFGNIAFAIAPLHSTFLYQEEGVSCHPAYLLMLHCLLSRCVVNGSIQIPQDLRRPIVPPIVLAKKG